LVRASLKTVKNLRGRTVRAPTVSFGFRVRLAVTITANAVTYAMPDGAAPWQFGLGQMDVDS